MKTFTLALASVSLLCLASAQPHRGRHAQLHEKKDNVVQVYVDQAGLPFSTTTIDKPGPTPVVAAVNGDAKKPTSTSSSAPAPSATSGGNGGGFGFSYSPYYASGKIKSQADIDTDFSKIPGGYGVVRIYGVDQGQTAKVLKAAKTKNLKLFCGIFNLANFDADIKTLIADIAGDWPSIDTIAIGNELVNSGSATAAEVVAKIVAAKSLLSAAGYTGPVVTTDTLVATLNAPDLCNKSDYCAVNSHPFFDGHTVAQDSGKFLVEQISNLRAKLSNKDQRIVISETGWPSQGLSNNKAVPSVKNQQDAISSIKASFSSNPSGVILFMCYDTMWKTNTPAQFEAEQYWGFLGRSSVD